MMYDFFVGTFIILGGFAFLGFMAEYIVPALFENDGIPSEWDGDYSE